MKTKEFDYHLPEELIAQYPLPHRTQSRLMHLCRVTGEIKHWQFADLLNLIKPNDLLVFNNTKVMPARLFGEKETGGKIEILIERIVDDQHALAHIKASKSPKPNTQLFINNALKMTVIERSDDLFLLKSHSKQPILECLNQHGELPLPPYISRDVKAEDQARYQTVYAQHEGAVAAPTAGLHFDQALMEQLNKQNIKQAYVTLHVGAGTFQPVRVDSIEAHKMHREYFELNAETCDVINHTKSIGGRVIAVGTTVVRTLETAATENQGPLQPLTGDTDIFIYPGYEFKVVDAMITNFHLPQSTLLMLISAFAGKEFIMNAYQVAVEQKYRFFSYGDAMLIA